MRPRVLAALLFLTACGARPQPHRFGSPMLGNASVPPLPLPEAVASKSPEVKAEQIRVTTMPEIREVSLPSLAGHSAARDQKLPAPHRESTPPPTIRVPEDLRALVGHRDTREPVAAALAWARELGLAIEATTGADVLAWAEANNRLHDASTTPERGDLLVFDRVNSDDEADVIGVAIARDARGVTEFVYLGGGVTRRGFVDATRPTTKRDKSRAIVNTFMRSGKRWPTKGSKYLSGEHLAHVIR